MSARIVTAGSVVSPVTNHKICPAKNHMTPFAATLLASHPQFRPVLAGGETVEVHPGYYLDDTAK
jgi:hypothetical protein